MILFGIMASLFLVLFATLGIFNSPTYAWRILRYGPSDIGDVNIFPERAVSKGETVSFLARVDGGTPYEVEYPYKHEPHKEILSDLVGH